MFPLVPLNSLLPGQIGQVQCVLGGAVEVRRMEELGVRHGANLELVRKGKPCIVKLNGNKLCFRDSDLLQVMVTAHGDLPKKAS